MLLDLNSATFDDDLTYIFERNVAKARRENKKLLDRPDGIKAEEVNRRSFGSSPVPTAPEKAVFMVMSVPRISTDRSGS